MERPTMTTSAPALPAPQIVLTMKLSAPDMDALLDAITLFAGTVDDPDRIAAIRIDEDACCAELDVAARPVDPRRLH
jgi:hypothetical protein